MPESKFKVTGPKSAVVAFRQQLSDDLIDGVELGNVAEEPLDPLDPRPLGMEPLTYFVIVVAAHVAAHRLNKWLDGKPKDAGGGSVTVNSH